MKELQLSKLLSYVLRHKPEEIGIELDSRGWTDVDTLIEQLNAHGHSVDKSEIINVVCTKKKKHS